MTNSRVLSGRTLSGAAAFLIAASAGFALTDTKIAGAASFTDIAIAGAFELSMSAAVLTGALVRSIITETIGQSLVKLTAMILILILKLFYDRSPDPKSCGISTAVCIFSAGAAVSAVIGEMLYKLLFYGFYSSLAGFTAYSIALIMRSFKRNTAIDLSSNNGCSYAVVYTLMVASLCSVKLPVISLGIAAGAAVTLLAACYYRSTGGVLCGALTTCGAFLASPQLGMTIVLLPAAGLLTGYLYKQKYQIIAGAFVMLNFMLIVLTGFTHYSIESMLNIIIGASLFMIAAPHYSDQWVITSADTTSALPEIMSSRMNFLADSIGTVREESAKIAELLAENTGNTDDIEENCNNICSHCYRRLICWKNDYDITMRAFRKLAHQVEFSRETFPYELDSCLYKDELAKSFEKSSRQKATAKLLEMRCSESRKLLSEHIRIMEELVESAGERIDVRYSEAISKVVRSKLEKYGYKPHNVIAYYNSRNRLLAELYFQYADAPASCIRICDLISDELGIRLASADPVNSGKEVRIRLFEIPAYSLEVYGASICADPSKENGDTSLAFGDGTGVSYVILSDGMGSGKSAAIESRMVVKIFRKLISCGVKHTSAIKLINSIMVTKSQEETFATLDAVRIDLDTCNLTVIKSGAAATIIRHRGKVIKITSPTFPIGIYEQSEIFSRDCEFDEGDIIIMFSDGVSENEYRFIKELLLGSSDIKYIVDEICRKADLFSQSVHSDDVTVIGIKAVRSDTGI